MPNDAHSAVTVCPFYLRNKTLGNAQAVVICEGCIPGTELTITFRTTRAKDAWMRGKCESFTYTECPFAKMLGEKYEMAGEEDGGP